MSFAKGFRIGKDGEDVLFKDKSVTPSAAGNVPLLGADGGLLDSGKPLTPAGIGAATLADMHAAGKMNKYYLSDALYVDTIYSGRWWYVNSASGTINMPTGCHWGYVMPQTLTDGYCKVTYVDGPSGLVAYRSYIDSVWGEWEWINPPMEVGVEYRTTERYNGQVVYRKLIYLGTFASKKKVNIGLDNYEHVLRYAGIIGTVPMPFFSINGIESEYSAWLEINNGYVIIYGNGFSETEHVYVDLAYCKTW